MTDQARALIPTCGGGTRLQACRINTYLWWLFCQHTEPLGSQETRAKRKPRNLLSDPANVILATNVILAQTHGLPRLACPLCENTLGIHIWRGLCTSAHTQNANSGAATVAGGPSRLGGEPGGGRGPGDGGRVVIVSFR